MKECCRTIHLTYYKTKIKMSLYFGLVLELFFIFKISTISGGKKRNITKNVDELI